MAGYAELEVATVATKKYEATMVMNRILSYKFH